MTDEEKGKALWEEICQADIDRDEAEWVEEQDKAHYWIREILIASYVYTQLKAKYEKRVPSDHDAKMLQESITLSVMARWIVDQLTVFCRKDSSGLSLTGMEKDSYPDVDGGEEEPLSIETPLTDGLRRALHSLRTRIIFRRVEAIRAFRNDVRRLFEPERRLPDLVPFLRELVHVFDELWGEEADFKITVSECEIDIAQALNLRDHSPDGLINM